MTRLAIYIFVAAPPAGRAVESAWEGSSRFSFSLPYLFPNCLTDRHKGSSLSGISWGADRLASQPKFERCGLPIVAACCRRFRRGAAIDQRDR